jgi:hypothetical protein
MHRSPRSVTHSSSGKVGRSDRRSAAQSEGGSNVLSGNS